MHRRTWDAKPKAMIALEGFKGKPVAELCHEHQIGQAQSYQRPGSQCTSQHWRSALNRAVNHQCPEDVRGQGLSLMSDDGCQPTPATLLRTCETLGIQQAFTSAHNPKGHADTERRRRTL